MYTYVPNILSTSRAVLSPILYYAITCHHWALASLIIAYTLISDGLDGWLARRWGVESDVGVLLDPLSDKCVLVALYMGVTYCETTPTVRWLCYALMGKEVVRVGSGAWMYASGTPVQTLQAMMPGKVMFVVNVLVGCALGYGLHVTPLLFCSVLASYGVLLLYVVRWSGGG